MEFAISGECNKKTEKEMDDGLLLFVFYICISAFVYVLQRMKKMTYWEDKESYIYVYQRMYMFYYWEDVK